MATHAEGRLEVDQRQRHNSLDLLIAKSDGVVTMKTTNRTPKKNAWKPWHGFAIEIEERTRIDGILILDNAPVACVVSVDEAREIAASHKTTHVGTYQLWARGINGDYILVPVEIGTRTPRGFQTSERTKN